MSSDLAYFLAHISKSKDKEVPIRKGFSGLRPYVIGTDPHCSLKINNSSGDVKERHCQLQLVNNQLRLTTIEGDVALNDKLVRAGDNCPISVSDVISLGSFRLKLLQAPRDHFQQVPHTSSGSTVPDENLSKSDGVASVPPLDDLALPSAALPSEDIQDLMTSDYVSAEAGPATPVPTESSNIVEESVSPSSSKRSKPEKKGRVGYTRGDITERTKKANGEEYQMMKPEDLGMKDGATMRVGNIDLYYKLYPATPGKRERKPPTRLSGTELLSPTNKKKRSLEGSEKSSGMSPSASKRRKSSSQKSEIDDNEDGGQSGAGSESEDETEDASVILERSITTPPLDVIKEALIALKDAKCGYLRLRQYLVSKYSSAIYSKDCIMTILTHLMETKRVTKDKSGNYEWIETK